MKKLLNSSLKYQSDTEDKVLCTDWHLHSAFSQVAKCDTCGHEGKLRQSLPILGEVKHFCDLKCLLHFCNKKVQMVNTGVFHCCINLIPGQLGRCAKPEWNRKWSFFFDIYWTENSLKTKYLMFYIISSDFCKYLIVHSRNPKYVKY